MPKMKTSSGAKKRFRLTASGRIKRVKAGNSHILTKKSRKRKRRLRRKSTIQTVDHKRVSRLLPYAG